MLKNLLFTIINMTVLDDAKRALQACEDGIALLTAQQKSNQLLVNDYNKLLDEITISNGIAFASDNKIMYYIDTPTKKVVKYDYDLENGSITNKTDLIKFNTNSFPDGMCIDDNQNLFIAEWGGSCISKWDSRNGKLLTKYHLPVLNITSCALDINNNIYITTAKSDKINEKFGGALLYLKFIK